MELSEADKKRVRAAWAGLSSQMEDIGEEALRRLFTVHPQTKKFFRHFDLSPGSADVKALGKEVMDGLSRVVTHLDQPCRDLVGLRALVVGKLGLDSATFQRLAQSILQTLQAHSRGAESPEEAAALDRFMQQVAAALYS
ncbi:hemoglobin subunit alpha-like [Eublepharis macularius]|uniref:Hemoglobin subunit alpha-like n=1 Tax=Eublepharis macularius TaxID=481883 RepID=A0AA97IV24_EUBMA|nr:hemoglobin subunit alpha-like [Eublepharis macularius]